MTDLLREALIAEGLDEPAISRVHEYLNRNDAYVTVNDERQWRREREAAKAAAVAAAQAMPDYYGAINRCQAQVTFPGRATMWSRCERRPTKVRRLPTGDTRKGVRETDGRLAVCGQHARTREIERWIKSNHWMDRGRPESAIEPVEPEYQP